MALLPAYAGVPTAPFIDPASGDISVSWRLFLINLLGRTGGTSGLNTADLATALAAETAARIAGDAAANHPYEFTQATAASVWMITHNLGIYPAVVVVDSSGNYIEGDILYTTTNSVTLTFTAPFSGVAYLI